MRRRIAKEIKGELIGKIKAGEMVVVLAARAAVSGETIYGWLRRDTGQVSRLACWTSTS